MHESMDWVCKIESGENVSGENVTLKFDAIGEIN